MNTFLLFFLLLFPAVLLGAPTEDPLGQTADYTLNRDRDRTTQMIRSGSLQVKVTDFFEHETYGWVYRAIFDLEMKIAIVGRKIGKESILLEKYYFTPEYWDELRKHKKVELETLTTHHLGWVTRGKYRGCDIVRFTNMVTETKDNPDGMDTSEMEFESFICESSKGLGASTIDMKGKAPTGMKFRAGFDLNGSFIPFLPNVPKQSKPN